MEVINHPDLSFAFDQTAIAEAPIYGTVKNIGVTAQIDRLLVKEDRVIIIDYKSNMEIPQNPLRVPKMYLRQLATYKKLMRDYDKVLVEEYLSGREIQVAVMGKKALGAIELVPKKANLADSIIPTIGLKLAK